MRSLILLLLVSCAVRAQQPFIRDLWLNENNTPVKVNALLQDKKGYIWLGTEAGLYRFNGAAFTRLSDSSNGPVTAVCAQDSTVWAGYRNGDIGRVSGRFVQRLPVRNSAALAAVTAIAAGPFGTLWLSTEQGFFAVINEGNTVLDLSEGLSDKFLYTLCPLPGGRVLAGSDQGIDDIAWNDGARRVNVLTTAQGLPDNIVRVIRPAQGADYCWIGTQQGGVALYEPQTRRIRVPAAAASWQWGQVNDILPLSPGHAWAATEEGYLLELRLADSNRSMTVSPLHYPGRQFRQLLCDRAGNIWCATNQGVSMLTAEYLACIRPGAGYRLRDVTAMTFGRDSTLWWAQNEALFRTSLKESVPAPASVYKAGAIITSLYADKEGRLWIGTLGEGLWCRSGATVRPVDGIAPLKGGNILSITGTDQRLWVAGLNGVEELSYPDPVTGRIRLIRHHNKQSGTGSDYIYQLYPDRKGRIWMATDGAGICMYDGARYHRWASLSQNPDSRVVYTITEDAAGNIWAGTHNKGLYCYYRGKWRHIVRETATDVNISGLAANPAGQVLAVYDRCIDQWYPRSSQFRHYNWRMDVGIDSVSGALNCLAKDGAGNIYIPAEPGILLFKNPRHAYSISPVVDITHLSVNLKSVARETHVFAHHENYISFHFEGISLTNPERLEYWYRLEGYNDMWIRTKDKSVTFPQLPPGDYTFRVRVKPATNMTAAMDSYSFHISAPVWKRPWAIILMATAVLAIVYGYIRQREWQFRRMAQLQQEHMKFAYDRLRSQVNPHFLFNSLNTLVNLIEEDTEGAVDYTTRLSDLYKDLLNYKDRDLILLAEEWDILSKYLYVQQCRFGKALQIHTAIPPELMHTKKILPMSLQLLVENAIKYNVVSLSRPLKIYISANESEITVANPLQPKLSTAKGAGIGLINISMRYQLLAKKSVTYGVTDGEYKVTLPLL